MLFDVTSPIVRALTVIALASVAPVELFILRVEKVVAPVIGCDAVPFKLTVPPLCVKVPLLVKLPAKFRVPDVEVRVPALMLSPFSVTVLLPRPRVPAPALVKVLVAREIVPPRVRLFADTVI